MDMFDKLELKEEMEKVSSKNLYDDIYQLYAEADKPDMKKFGFAHLAYTYSKGLVADVLKKTGQNTSIWDNSTKSIDKCGGDIHKIKDFQMVLDALNGVELYAEATKNTKYISYTKDIIKVLETNVKVFKKAYAIGVDFFAIHLFEMLVMSVIIETSVLSFASSISQANPNEELDDIIEKTPAWKEFFLKTDEIITDKSFNKFVLVGKVSLKAEAVQEQAETIASICHLYSEVSISDIALIMKLGLAQLAYKIAGVLRFIIFMCLVSKYSFEDRIEQIKSIMIYNNSDLTVRTNNQEQMQKNIQDLRVSLIEEMDYAQKENDNFKIDKAVDEENAFEL